MKGKKNLERAIILGLILSTGVYGSAWADPAINDDTVDSQPQYKDSVTIEGDANTSAIEITEDNEVPVTIKGEESITLESGKYGIRLEADRNITLDAVGDNVIKVTANSTDSEIGDGINVTENAGGTITLQGANNTITVNGEHSDGIYTDTGSNTNIDLIAATGNNTITATNNGIDHRGNGDVILTANNGANEITATNGDGIRVEGTGTVEFSAQNNTITAGDNGIQVTGGGTVNVTATGNNTITANTNGIYASGENSSAVLNGYNTNITVANTNIDSSIRGIDADNSSKITINSNQDIKFDLDTIGVYGRGINGQNGSSIALTSKNGSIEVNVSTGAPNAKGGNVYGINLEGVNTKADLTAGQDIIITTNSSVVEQRPGAGANDVVGIRAQYGASVNAIANGAFYINSTDENSTNVGIRAQDDNSYISVTANGMNKDGYGVNIISNGKISHGVLAQDGSVDIFSNAGNIYLSASATEAADAIYAAAISNNVNTKLEANGDVILNAYNDTDISSNANYVAGIFAYSANDYNSKIELTGNNIKVTANSENNTAYGIYASDSDVTLLADVNNVLTAKTYGMYASNSNVELKSNNGINQIETDTTGIRSVSNAIVNLNANQNQITGNTGIWGESNSQVTLTANVLNNKVTTTGYGIYADSASNVNFIANEGINNIDSGNSTAVYSNGENTVVDLTAKGNSISANTGIWSLSNGQVKLNANDINNEITTTAYGIYANTISNVDLTAKENSNIIKSGNIDEKGFGNQTAIYALSGSNVNLTAANKNDIAGWVYAYGDGTTIDLKGVNNKNVYNSVLSSMGVNGAGGLTDITVVSALFADNKSNINLSGINNIQTYYDDPEDTHTSERAVWAYKGANINIDGLTTIKTYLYEKSPNSMDLAIAAGTATNLDFDTVNANNPEEGMAIVDIDYDSYTYDDNGAERTAVSSIEGDILAAYGGIVDIAPKSADTVGINITGNLLAGNNGDLTVNLGNGGVLTGRADDYGDAGVVDNSGHGTTFFDPAFSSEIYKGGQVNLDMGGNSRWNVTGQSWITSIDTTNDSGNVRNNAIIDLISANTDRNTTAHALTVYKMNGDATFNMSLDADRNVSDMLYIKNSDGNYIINVVDAVTTADMYANGFDGLRFATVGEGSNANFRAVTVDQGVLNVEYEVDTDSYANNDENTAYNGGSNMSDHKPGDTMVDGFFGSNGAPGEPIETPATNGIMTLDLAAEENAEMFTDDGVVESKEGGLNEVTNFKLVARKGEDLSDGGKAVLNMSRANYSNAIYMDRLNKRLGEARYINDDPEEDEGMWVRIRHDRIGKEDAFRSQNTMYQLGYDKRQECDNGERRVGFAVDYMHGDTGYTDIAGKGEIDRYGLWLYDTWMGDKGHYADYIAKWGHLDNDFEIYAPTTGERIDGDYSNNVFSVSAEYGRKKDIGNDWYFEPQAQLQLARVTGAEYTTSQGTKVSVDGINSLIGRAGFRIGKDFGEEKQSTLYFKADVLHEFLGDQDISAMDKTTNGNWSTISYENEGTWYDVGFGFATQMSKNSYAFMDFEKSFGNDNDETYQINVGMQWSF